MTREDSDIAIEMARILSGEEIEILVQATPIGVAGRSGEHVTLSLRTASGEQKINGSHLLVAVGRVPNTADIGLETAKVELNARGYVRVNERLQTSAPDVWAIGECAGSPQFTHVSVDDYRIVKANMTGGQRSTRDRLVPYVVFTDPPLARVGLSEGEAQRGGIAARCATLPMLKVLRTTSTDETDGFMKILVANDDDRILGFAMIGSEAGEVMAVIETAMLAALPYQKLRDAVLTHLTMAEGLGSLLANVPPRAP
jgi:pyruvate/2-oxoglutarate dehydrogenase complex dihydrolipoamide dehydrogenase (E3) component